MLTSAAHKKARGVSIGSACVSVTTKIGRFGSLLALAFITVAQSAPPDAMQSPATPAAMQSEGVDMGNTEMMGWLGYYPMTREASGTSWQPDDSPTVGSQSMMGKWSVMTHGALTGVYDDQQGPRGDSQIFASSMGMLMASRPAMGGTFGTRAMLSLDPVLIGDDGYPLLLQTGETADGRTLLIDRQHPHDLFMELSAAYSHKLGEGQSWFTYVGLPGEPALGPPTYMHRFSGVTNPETPLTHHWLDSTHVSFGVATLGYVLGDWKLDGSVFNGREPDQNRYDIETRNLDSRSVRLSWNPSSAFALQVSQGWLKSPEQLDPNMDIERSTASLIHQVKLGDATIGQTTVAYGLNNKNPGPVDDAWLLDSVITRRESTTLFARFERISNDDLFALPDPLAGREFRVSKLSLGAAQKLWGAGAIRLEVGALASRHFLPAVIEPAYSRNPMSYLGFLRVSFGKSSMKAMQ